MINFLDDKNTIVSETASKILGIIRKEGILPGQFIPTEALLLDACQVSRNALREAVSYLKGLGILQSRQGSGVKLASLDPVVSFEESLSLALEFSKPDLNDIMDARNIMEMGAIKMAVRCASEEDIAEINTTVKKLENILLDSNCSWDDYNNVDAQFHCAIMKPARCRLLSSINNIVLEFFNEFNLSKIPSEDWREVESKSQLEHNIIAQAFVIRNPELAYVTLEKHLKA